MKAGIGSVFVAVVAIVAIAVIAYCLLANWAGDPLGVQKRTAAALDTGVNAGKTVSIVDNPDLGSAFSSWLGEVTTNTGLRW